MRMVSPHTRQEGELGPQTVALHLPVKEISTAGVQDTANIEIRSISEYVRAIFACRAGHTRSFLIDETAEA